jgi:hypothetical protein
MGAKPRSARPNGARTAVITNTRAGRDVSMESRPVNGGADQCTGQMEHPPL